MKISRSSISLSINPTRFLLRQSSVDVSKDHVTFGNRAYLNHARFANVIIPAMVFLQADIHLVSRLVFHVLLYYPPVFRVRDIEDEKVACFGEDKTREP